MLPHDDLCCTLAAALRRSRAELAATWLERISARVSLSVSEVFPSEDLLNHVPLLIEGIAGYVERPEDDIDAQAPVIAKARELGALRHAQGFDAYQLLKEYDLLGSILMGFVGRVIEEDAPECSASGMLRCLQRLMQAVELVRQATTVHFLQLAAETVREREDRLRRFNRMVSHELKNRVSAIKGAVGLLGESWLDTESRDRFLRMAGDNVGELQHVLENLEALSRLEADSRQQRNVLLPQAAAEAARQLRDMAQVRGVAIEIADDLPAVEVNAAAVELCLTNYISNAIKYCDPAREQRRVQVTGEFRPREAGGRGGELTVKVIDNGIGVPQESRQQLFAQFFRAPNSTVTGAEGTGLGLSLVRETVAGLGGRAWAEFPDDGTTCFAFALPSRREEDAAAAGVMRRA